MNLLERVVSRALGPVASAEPLVRPADAVLARGAREPDPMPESVPGLAAAMRAPEPPAASAGPVEPSPQRSAAPAGPPAVVAVSSSGVAEPGGPMMAAAKAVPSVVHVQPAPALTPEPPRLLERERVERSVERIIVRELEPVRVSADPGLAGRAAPEPAADRAEPSPAPRAAASARAPSAQQPPEAPARRQPAPESAAPRAEAPRPRAIVEPRLAPPSPRPGTEPRSSAPVVHVHIDRIIVNAEPPARTPPRASARPAGADELLARYLAGRSRTR